MTWKLWLDDVRPAPEGFAWCKSTDEAFFAVCKWGMPSHMSLDHDLGGDDTTMVFLRLLDKWLYTDQAPPTFTVHSANPVGAANIVSFMKSWEKHYIGT